MTQQRASAFGELDIWLARAGRHEELWAKLGAHPLEDGVRFGGRVTPRGGRRGAARACARGGHVRGPPRRSDAATALRARRRLRGRRALHDSPPVLLHPHDRRARPPPRGRGAPRAALREARRPLARARRRRRRGVRPLGAVGALRERGRRLQLLGRAPSPDALDGLVGDLGAVRSRRSGGHALQVRDPDGRG